MSEHDLSLRALATECARQVSFYKGQPFNTDLRILVTRVAERYCLRAKERWGIEMIPKIDWDEDQGLLSIGAEPAGPLDEAMLCAQMIKEGLSPC